MREGSRDRRIERNTHIDNEIEICRPREREREREREYEGRTIGTCVVKDFLSFAALMETKFSELVRTRLP